MANLTRVSSLSLERLPLDERLAATYAQVLKDTKTFALLQVESENNGPYAVALMETRDKKVAAVVSLGVGTNVEEKNVATILIGDLTQLPHYLRQGSHQKSTLAILGSDWRESPTLQFLTGLLQSTKGPFAVAQLGENHQFPQTVQEQMALGYELGGL